jgi:DNA repair protein RadA/Sms
MRLTDPSSDLAVAIALASAYANLPLPTTAVMIGEVGLAGDLRRVSGMQRRLIEAARQGFNIALIPPGCDGLPPGMRALTAPTIVAALEHMIDIGDHRSGAPPRAQWLDA